MPNILGTARSRGTQYIHFRKSPLDFANRTIPACGASNCYVCALSTRPGIQPIAKAANGRD